MYDYYYGSEVEKNSSFFRVPYDLFKGRLKSISCEAKLLYSLMLDRTGLSYKNEWKDNDGRIFVYYKQEEACETLNIGKEKAVKIFAELESLELIKRKKQGQGKPTIIYVKNITAAKEEATETFQTSEKQKSEKNVPIKNSEKPTSRLPKNRSQEVSFSRPILYNHIENNQINSTISNPADDVTVGEIINERKKLAEQLELDILLEQSKSPQNAVGSYDEIKSVYELMCDTVCTSKHTVHIGQREIPLEVVKNRFYAITGEHIGYVLESVKNTKAPIRNMRGYLITALYNAPTTFNSYIAAAVNRMIC